MPARSLQHVNVGGLSREQLHAHGAALLADGSLDCSAEARPALVEAVRLARLDLAAERDAQSAHSTGRQSTRRGPSLPDSGQGSSRPAGASFEAAIQEVLF